MQMEMLKSCIANQLRTIQENEDRAIARSRNGRHALKKGEGIDKIESMKRTRSSPALRRTQVNIFAFTTLPPLALQAGSD